ncbi:MAG: site-specific integrase, partial [Tannerella sp.]|nr:site-specific integrase [Tannerella sp.]
MRSTFKVLFYLKKNAPKKTGLVPVMCRVTIDGTISQFSCKLDIDPRLWDTAAGRAAGRSDQSVAANRLMDKIRAGITKHYQDIFEREGYVNAEKVRNAYLGLDCKLHTLLAVYGDFLNDFEKMCQSGSRSKSTLCKYRRVYTLLAEFVRRKFNRSDIALKEIQPAFITDFEFFLRMDKGCDTNTVWIYMMPLRKMITLAVNHGWLHRDPFWEYEIAPEEKDRGFLSADEIKSLMDMKFRRTKRALVRDMFIFCCFTGLSFRDLRNLTTENLQIAFDGKPWIITRRQKTGVQSNIRLLDIPLKIIEKYRGTAKGDRLLPVPTYSTARTGIKAIASECGIPKTVTWHVSRHTYATQVCLKNGMPIESISRTMGHKNISTTQIYAKVIDEKVSGDMEMLSA